MELNEENKKISLAFKNRVVNVVENGLKSKLGKLSYEELQYLITHFEDVKIYLLGFYSALI